LFPKSKELHGHQRCEVLGKGNGKALPKPGGVRIPNNAGLGKKMSGSMLLGTRLVKFFYKKQEKKLVIVYIAGAKKGGGEIQRNQIMKFG